MDVLFTFYSLVGARLGEMYYYEERAHHPTATASLPSDIAWI